MSSVARQEALQSAGARLEALAARHGAEPALRDLRREPLTFSDVAAKVRDIRESLAFAGIRGAAGPERGFEGTGEIACGITGEFSAENNNGDRVALWMENRADAALWLTAIGQTCACLPLARSMSPELVRHAFEVLGVTALITDGSENELLARELAALDVPRLVVTNRGTGWDWTLDGRIGPAYLPEPDAPGDAIAYYLVTSGSTGTPKIVPVTHQAIALTTRRAAEGLELRPGDRALNVMPLNHVHGLISGVFLPWAAASCTIMPGAYDAADFLEWYAEASPTWFSTSPAIYRDILRRAEASGATLCRPGLRFLRCGSSALDDALRARIEDAFAVPLLNAYGMSETLQIAGVPLRDRRRNSVGVPIADEVGIFDGDLRIARRGEVGEIRIRGRTVMPHYVGDPERATGFQDGWFKTGDLGHLDAEGHLHVVGRMGDRINCGGETIAPAEVEAALLSIDGIEAALCFGVKHDVLGEAVAAAVVPAPGSALKADEVRRKALAFLPANRVPARIYVLDEIPRDGNGKYNRREIAEWLAAAPLPGGDSAPSGPVETIVAAAFRRVLRTEDIDADSDFFENGGTSLDIVELLLELEGKLGATIHVPVMFEAPTVRSLAAFLAREYRQEVARIAPEPAAGGSSADVGMVRADVAAFRASLPDFDDTDLERSLTSPIFILSAPRCGSTLLRVMMAGNAGLFSPPEMRLLQYRTMGEWAARHDGPFRFFRDGLVQAYMTATGCGEDRARAWLDGAIADDRPVETVYTHLQAVLGQRTIVDKSPHYALDRKVLKSIPERFRRPRFIVLYRNPVEMKRSFVEARMHQVWMHGGPDDPGALAEMIWTESYANIEAFAKTQLPASVMRLHFEDLVADPQQAMARICRFARVPADPRMPEIFDGTPGRMTAGLGAGAGAPMIGDPRFLHHDAIDPSRAGAGFTLPEEHGLGPGCLSLARMIGYRAAGDARSEANALHNQRQLLKSWGRSARRIDDFLFGYNLDGRELPLFWVFQQEDEAERLSAALGRDRPVYCMRSGHLVMNRFDPGMAELARTYADSIDARHPAGPLLIGGNCQGADVALEMARIFIGRGREVVLLIAVDADIQHPVDTQVAHIFGDTSHWNPFARGADPRPRWKRSYRGYTVDFLPCGHGQYFTETVLPVLTGHIETRISAALSRATRKPRWFSRFLRPARPRQP